MKRHLAWLMTAALCIGCAGNDDESGGGADASGVGGAGGVPGQGGTPGQGGGGPGGNQRPELKRIGDRTAPVGEQLLIQLQATDPEGDPLSYNVRSSLPEGAKFEKATGEFTWTPSPSQDGTLVLITFEVSDGTLKDQETIQITVVPAGQGGNQPPRFDELGDQVLTAGRPFSLQLEATDANGDPLTFRYEGDMLPGATLDEASGLFAWTPSVDLAGNNFNVSFIVTDGQADDRADVVLAVREDGGGVNPGNLPPRIRPIDDRQVRVGEMITLVVEADDDDPASLTFAVAGPLPEGAAFDAASATFRWTPSPGQAEQAFGVVFQVSDGEFRAVERVSFQVIAGDARMCTPDGIDQPVELVPNTPTVGTTICPDGDRDEFDFDLAVGQRFVVGLTFVHADGDVDLIVNGPNGDQIGFSAGVLDSEVVQGTAEVAGTYTARVYAVAGATNAYSLELAVNNNPPPACADDAFDGGGGNDTAQDAADLRAAVGGDLQICSNDVDFYAIELQAGARVTLRALFRHADGDIDVRVTGPGGYTGRANSSTDDEEIFLDPVPATGLYTIEVFGFSGAQNSYRLELDEEGAAPCTADRVEPNDTIGDAEPFRADLFTNLTWCGDPDWYKTDVPAGQTLLVYLSFDGARPPQVTAYRPNSARIEGQSYSVEMVSNQCRANRAGCRVLRVPNAPGGFIHYEVNQGTHGQGYDLNVNIDAGAPGGACAVANQTCDDLSVCDYATGDCADAFCDLAGVGCPNTYTCEREWCVEACQAGNTCRHPDHTCKDLARGRFCGLTGAGQVGGDCYDFTDCAGALDCLGPSVDVPDGYCTRACVADADCGAGAQCARFDDGNYCSQPCQIGNECRDGYGCNTKPRVGGGSGTYCTPGFEI